MNYNVNDIITLSSCESYVVQAVILDDGERDDSISLYVGLADDGHHDLIADDNARPWIVGDADDPELNWSAFDALDDRIDDATIESIRAVNAELAKWIAERMRDAREMITISRDSYEWRDVTNKTIRDVNIDMRDVVTMGDVWRELRDGDYIRRGYGENKETWHYIDATDDVPGRAEWGDEDYPVYCLAPWDPEEGDDADGGNWGYYDGDGKRLGE